MLNLTISHTLQSVSKSLQKQQKQVRFATAVALTRTAGIAKREVVDAMRKNFDRPTPYTLRSIFTKRATALKLEASAYVKDDYIGGGQNLSTAELLKHQFSGGKREAKRSEWRFRQAGLMSGNEFLVPAKAAKLDAYGNVSKGQMQQIMSQVRVGLDPYAYASKSKRSQRNQTKAGEYFWSHGSTRGHNGNLPRGVWLRKNGGRFLQPVLLVVKAPNYRRRIDLDKIRQLVITRDFDREFTKALDYALRTAR